MPSYVTSCRIAYCTNPNVWLSRPEAVWSKAGTGKLYWSVKNESTLSFKTKQD